MGTVSKIFVTLFITIFFLAGHSQVAPVTTSITQKTLANRVQGYVRDEASRQPMVGVVVTLISDNAISVLTDSNGHFVLEKVKWGTHSIQFTMVGYETFLLPAVEVIAGKTVELDIALRENFKQLKEVIVQGKSTRSNEFAIASARSFRIEEIKKYSTMLADPARMVMNFPGVSGSGDNSNSLVVRGNSPKGMIWRLEGIEIPNPNHFSTLGNSGGAISMLNANTLGNCQFYSGAFMPEIGSAFSGAFDIFFRNGTTTRREHSLQVGTLGIAVASEGPFENGKNSSYLFSYRYSTFAVIKNFIDLGPSIPNYQDLSFKLNFPTKKLGTFSIFGLAGATKDSHQAIPDSSVWINKNDNRSFSRTTLMGVAGITHELPLNAMAYIKTVVAFSTDQTADHVDTLNPSNSYNHKFVENTDFTDKAFRISSLYNQKLNANHSFRVGVIAQLLGYDLSYRYLIRDSSTWKSILDAEGNTWFYEAFLQWKSKLTKRLTIVGGFHSSYYLLNKKKSFEPRASLSYVMQKTKLSVAAGFHSKPEHISTYMFQKVDLGQPVNYPNRNLDLLRAFHVVTGIERNIFRDYNIKAEFYLQKLYHIPVESDSTSGFSVLNSENVFSLLETNAALVSTGKGMNYGVDLSIEHPLMDGYFVVATTSIFSSTYTNFKGDRYNTRFNRGFQVNIIAGKEIRLDKSGRQVIGLNGKLLYSGGLRESPIDLAKSATTGRTEYLQDSYYTHRVPAYFRTDASVYYKLNTKKATHSFEMAAQNLTNRKNYAFSYFDNSSSSVRNTTQLGFIPNITYRVDFHF